MRRGLMVDAKLVEEIERELRESGERVDSANVVSFLEMAAWQELLQRMRERRRDAAIRRQPGYREGDIETERSIAAARERVDA